MFTLSLIILIAGGIILTGRLRSIQKHSRSLSHFTKLQGEIMAFLRNDGFQLGNSEYKKARKLYEMNESLIKIYSCQRPSSFHIKTFFTFLNSYAKPVYNIDKRAQSLKPKNEKLKVLQIEFVETVEWSIFYNTPIYVIMLILLSIFPIMVSVLALNRTKSFYNWYKKIVSEQSKEYFSEKYNLPNTGFARI